MYVEQIRSSVGLFIQVSLLLDLVSHGGFVYLLHLLRVVWHRVAFQIGHDWVHPTWILIYPAYLVGRRLSDARLLLYIQYDGPL